MAQAASVEGTEKLTYAVDLKERKLDPAGFASESMRNICILAHVDHGKTCVADCLLTLNGLVNKRCIGKTKYLDDRPDEQDRKITMKSSAVSIGFHLQLDDNKKSIPFLINLVDTPGHIDFSTEVVAATRICDGALIVVDVVEGVSPQTKIAIKYAYDEKLKMILIINKFDRLILDLQLPVGDMFFKLLYIVEQCNSYIASLEEFDILKYQSESHLEDRNYVYVGHNFFDPIKGNVIFASAIDSWGFTLRRIATMYTNLIEGETVESLTEKLWEIDLYVSSKDKRIKAGAAERGIPNVFTQLACSMVNHIYTTLSINDDELGVAKIVNKLGVDASVLPLKFYSCKMKLKFIMEAWSSLAKTIASQCYYHIPAPTQVDEKINYLIDMDRYSFYLNSDSELKEAITAFKKCSTKGPPIAYITKLLIENKLAKPLLQEYVNAEFNNDFNINSMSAIDKIISKLKNVSLEDEKAQMMALVRIYSGVLQAGQELVMINSDYDPVQYLLGQEPHYEHLHQLHRLTIKNVFVLLGPEYKSVESLGAGYICGITCSEHFPPGNVTLSENLETPPIIQQHKMEPIVYNVITPIEPKNSHILRVALQILQKFDTCLRTFINEFGEYVVTTAGKVHLEKCLMDLKRNLIDIAITVSPPIYSLRETVEQIVMLPLTKTIDVSLLCKINIELSVVMLPKNISTVIQTHHNVLNMIQNQEIPTIADICLRLVKNEIRHSKTKTFTPEFYDKVVAKLKALFNKSIRENDTTVWNSINVMDIMRIGASKDNINLIINDVIEYNCNLFTTQDEYDSRVFIYNYFVNAFNLACDIGPICKEPVSNCAFILSEFNVVGPINALISNDPLVGNHITQQFKQLFLDVILKEDIGVMEPVLEAVVQTEIQWLGGVYSEVHKRFGQVLPFDCLEENSKYISVRAYIPALDGEDFITGIRKISAGTATVWMAFSHYKLTASDYVDDNAARKNRKTKLNNRAEQLVKTVRLRKGIKIHDQVVFHAEKQRTLKK
ncbi:hypothetical protein RN001_016068 [Aquatica leii]|uniref:Tr-type G domain-containing protein n=1 Tax=Aquatica leii TaxID=1421715 RepID=A0AAN7NXI7_9COLE|nr:hypothetical protein RN001_016068 [Aquatica leii]